MPGFPGCGLAKCCPIYSGNIESLRTLNNKKIPLLEPRQASEVGLGETHYGVWVLATTSVDTIFVEISTPTLLMLVRNEKNILSEFERSACILQTALENLF